MAASSSRALDDATLVALSDLNHLEANRELARRAGGVVLDEDGLLFWVGAHPLPVLANAVVRTDPRVTPADVLARGRRFFAKHRRGFSVILCGTADADIAPVCAAAGLFRMGDSPGMVLEHRRPDATPAPGVTIRTVETEADGGEFARVNGEAYATYGMANDVTPKVLGRLDVMRAPHITSVLACVDGVAMAAAMVMLTHGIGGVYWVGTTPAARGKGLAALCTRVVGNIAVDAGGTPNYYWKVTPARR